MRTHPLTYCILSLLLVLVTLEPADANLTVLDGDHTVVYDIVNPRGVAFIPDYSNESFEQKVLAQDEFSKRVKVTSRLHAMRTRVPFPVRPGVIPSDLTVFLQSEKDRQSNDPAIIRVATEVTRNSSYMHEAANAILSWIADNLTFDTTITVPSDALSALHARKAYCVGYSNLAVALLRAAGIPARVAHGYLPPGYEWGFSKEYWGVKVNDGGYHAYIEIFYPDTGWVFSDAEHSHNFVDPFHIILRIDGVTMPGVVKGGYLEVDKATFYTIFQEVDTTIMVDELEIPRQKRLGRRLSDRQHSALISGSVVDGKGTVVPKGTVVLWKDGKGSPTSFSGGRYSTVVSAPGNYRIELRGPGFRKSTQELKIEQGKVYRSDFTLLPGGVIKGTVRDASGRPVQDGDVFYREGNTSFGVPVNRDGSYRIEGLTPGQYKVSVMQDDKDIIKTGDVAAGKDTTIDFILQ